MRRPFYFCNMSPNSKAFTRNGEAYCASVGANYVGIYGSIFGNKCCINTSMTNAKWHTSFLGSTLIVPFNILVWDVVHLINSFYNCLNIIFAQSTYFPLTTIIMDIKNLLLSNGICPFDILYRLVQENKCHKGLSSYWHSIPLH